MIDILLASQTITLLTSLAPVGAWIAKESGVFAKSIAVSTITDFVKIFFRNKIKEKELKNFYIQSVQAALDDRTLKLDDATRMSLENTKDSFIHFLNFVNTYDQLNTLPFTERREKSIQILRKYIKERVDLISDEGLDKIVDHFSYAAFGLINECIRKDPEAFYREGLASLERIENHLIKNNQKFDDIYKQNLEILKTTALYYQKLAPEIKGFGDYLSKIESKLDEIRSVVDETKSKVDEIRDTQNYQTSLIENQNILLESIYKNTEIPFRKSVEYIALKEENEKLKKAYHDLLESDVQLRLKYSLEIEDREKKIKLYEKDGTRLYESIQNGPIDTERLRQAKLCWEEGNIQRAGELLNAEDLRNDQQQILIQHERNLKSLKESNKQRLNNATEFLIKAQITALDYSNPKRFDEVKEYYSRSVQSYPFINNLFNFASFLQENLQFNDAESMYMRLLKDFKEAMEQNDLAVTLHNLGVLHKDMNRLVSAENEFYEALSIFRTLADTNPTVYLSLVAMTLNNMAILHLYKYELSSAENEFSEALSIYSTLADANPTVYLSTRADILNNLAIIHKDMNELDSSENEFYEALSIYSTLADTNSSIFLSKVAYTLNNLAILHKDMKELGSAERESSEALSIYSTLADANPTIYLRNKAGILNNLAIIHKAMNELDSAENEFYEALSIYSTLADANPTVFLPFKAGILFNIADLHWSQEKLDSAEREFSKALSIYSTLADTNPSVFLSEVAMTLNKMGNLHWSQKKLDSDEREFSEALSIYRTLADANPSVFLSEVAKTLYKLAVFHWCKNELDSAEREFSEALPIYRTLADANPSAFLSEVATILNILAKIHLDKSEVDSAESEFSEAFSIYRTLADGAPTTYHP